jgi:hypothetical protein
MHRLSHFRPAHLLVALAVLGSLLAIPEVPLAAQEPTNQPQASHVPPDLDPAPDSSDFEIRRVTIEAEIPGSAGLISGGKAQLVGEPNMVILLPEESQSLAMRSRNAGVWGDWIVLDAGHDEAPDGLEGEEGAGGPRAVGPIWIGDDADAIEVAATDGDLGRVTIETLEPVDRDDPPLVGNVLPGQPTIQPRANWATRGFATEHAGCEDGPRLASNIRAAVVHHTVTGNSYDQGSVPAQLRAIYRLHVDINGWCDIAYNFVVDRFGTIWEARTGGVDQPVIGGHAKGFNTWTVGVAILGQHQSGASPSAAVPTSATMASVQALVGWKLGLHGVDPRGTTWLKNDSSGGVMKFPFNAWVEVPTVVGHRDLGVTSCPGSHTVPFLPGMREALAAGRTGQPPYSFVAHQPYEHGPAFVTLDDVGGLRPAGSATQPLGELVPGGSVALAVDGGPTGGYVLTSASTLIDYGSAPTIVGVPSGALAATDLDVVATGDGGWVLDLNGGVHAFGSAPAIGPGPAWPGTAVALHLDDAGVGYVVSSSGELFPLGGAPFMSLATVPGSPVVDVAVRSNRSSGWVLDAAGLLHPFGDAPDWQTGTITATAPTTAARAVLVGDNDRGGWVLDAEGRLKTFGDERRVLPISTSVGTPTAVDGAIVDWVRDERSDLIRFANALAELFLGVAPTPDEADWIGVRTVYDGRSVVVGELARSDAWAGRLIDDMYVDVLGRPADTDGRAYWLERLRNGLRTQDLGANFYSSPEYVASGGDAAGYVTLLYAALLDRPPDQDGLDYWVTQLKSGAAVPGEITLGFYQSPESRRGRVGGLYQQILGRDPDADGLDYWAERLQTFDDITLAIELATSVEFYVSVTDPAE